MNINLSDAASIATIVGTIIAILVAIYGIYKFFRSKQPRLKAELEWGLLDYVTRASEPMFIFTISNPSDREAIIASVELVWKERKKVIILPDIGGERRLPYPLPPNDRLAFWYPVKAVETALKEQNAHGTVKLKARFRDMVGNEYLSKPFPLDISQQPQA